MHHTVILVTLFTMMLPCQATQNIIYTITEEGRSDSIIGNIATALTDVIVDDSVIFELLTKPRLNFVLDSHTGFLSVNGRLDRDVACARERVCTDQFRVTAAVRKLIVRVVKVTVEILDVNDNTPMFAGTDFQRSVLEGIGGSVMIPLANDSDSPAFGIQRYTVQTEQGAEFELEATTSGIRLTAVQPLDHEVMTEHRVRVFAHDGGSPSLVGSTAVTITVLDANDNVPVFAQSAYKASVEENVIIGSTVLTVAARDDDTGSNQQIVYSLSPDASPFTIDAVSGDVIVAAEVDYEKGVAHRLTVTATDNGTPPLSATALVTINVLDVNDHAPVITVHTPAGGASIPEDAGIGTFVAHVMVTDADDGLNADCTCSMTAANFGLESLADNMEYQLVSAHLLDYEQIAEYSVVIRCADRGNPPRDTIQHVHINVTDVNDNSPTFHSPLYSTSINENNAVGDFILQVAALDADTGNNGVIRYSISPDMRHVFDVDSVSGVVTSLKSLDHELVHELLFHVVAVDAGAPQRTSSVLVTLEVTDENDESPVFSSDTYVFNVTENLPSGSTVGKVTATDADDFPYNEFRFRLLSTSDNFHIDAGSGLITTLRPLDREAISQYTVMVTVSDFHDPPRINTATAVIGVADINDNRPTFLFPSATNNTAAISNHIPIGHVVAQPRAIDPDSGVNGRLTYRLTSGNRLRLFSIDPDTGDISVNSYLSHVDYQRYHLGLMATDGGSTPWTAHTELIVIVDSSLPYVAPASVLGGKNFSVAVSLAAVSAVIVIILIIAIIVISRRRRRPVSPPGEVLVKRSYSNVGQLPYDVDTGSEKGRNSKVVENEYKQMPRPQRLSSEGDDVSNADSGRGPSEEGERRQCAMKMSSPLPASNKLKVRPFQYKPTSPKVVDLHGNHQVAASRWADMDTPTGYAKRVAELAGQTKSPKDVADAAHVSNEMIV